MLTLSLCMIVKNEEESLGKCLMSIQGIADEIIIVDTGSTDETKKTAKNFTDKIYDFPWIDDFAAARNFSFEKATMDYVMWLDADDILLKEDRDKLAELKNTLAPSVDVVMMKYNTAFDARGNVTFSYYRERIVKRACNFRWHEPVHEYLDKAGNILNADIAVTHMGRGWGPANRNIAIYEKQLSKGRELTPRGLYYYARELKDNGKYGDAAEYFIKFLDSGKGWVEDNINACLELSRCYGRQNMREKEFMALVRSFIYDTPRAEICCQIGYLCKAAGDYQRAIFWFELVSALKEPEGNWGFTQPDCWGYIPFIELTVCYDRLGRHKEAAEYNEKAGALKPGDPSVEFNRRYFQSLKN
jgi:glycosyltransferase involved in cell wall biosynthesis